MKMTLRPAQLVLASIFASSGLWITCGVLADDIRSLPEVEVTSSRYGLVGVADNASEGVAGQFQIQNRVVARVGEGSKWYPG